MAILLSCQNLSKSYGARPLFEGLSFGLFEGDRIGMIGPNGSGKSTLLAILAGNETPDAGNRTLRKSTRLAYLPQTPVFPKNLSVRGVLEHILSTDPRQDADKAASLNQTLGIAEFADPDQRADTLSGGWKKRLAIASALVQSPDLLLLDEPTNHLDIEGILWLESLLKRAPFAYLVVSHDRTFLESVAKRTIEINRCYKEGLLQVDGAYSDFLVHRDAYLHNQSRQADTMANKVRREVEWLRRGPKARTTKQQARIQEAGRMMDELGELRFRSTQLKAPKIDFAASERETRRLVVVDHVDKSQGGNCLFRDLTFTLSPGTKLGLIGRNGSGKSTLLKLLKGELKPDSGTIKTADFLRIVSFDQDRHSLDPKLTLRRTLAPYGDTVLFRDQPVHIVTWAKRFLFRPEQLDMPVGKLSGGEQARTLIAKLMLEAADLLLLDEPTNDLDIPTLEVLEESLSDFPGALVLITHDRYLLDRVSTILVGLDGRGNAERFADYAQWEAAQRLRTDDNDAQPSPSRSDTTTPKKTKKLSYNDQRDWDQMESKITAAEAALAHCHRTLEDPAVASDVTALQTACDALHDAQATVDKLYARWAELEKKQREI